MKYYIFDAMNFTLVLLSMLFLFSCQPKSAVEDVRGDLSVRIPVVKSSVNNNITEANYQLEVVTLKGISNLKEVMGQFVQFFYAPGLTGNQLTGNSPQARFIKTRRNIYVPVDRISLQMATLYYNIQGLTEFSQKLGLPVKGPFKIGIETQVGETASELSRNNAFYDGHSDSMLFVPYDSSQLPIAVNSGIVAHEYFHSIFYDRVIRTLAKDFKELSLFNETYLRGMNEGLADFWGWVYTNDVEFIKWSLPAYTQSRGLNLQTNQIGRHESAEKIKSKIKQAQFSSDDPSQYLSDYIYKIGTPYARFLKMLTSTIAERTKQDLEVTKLEIAKVIIHFIDQKVSSIQKLKTKDDELKTYELFELFKNKDAGVELNQDECKFVLSYLSEVEEYKNSSCVPVTESYSEIKSPEVIQ